MEISWIDLVIVAILIISIIRGYMQGFIKAFLSLFLLIISLILANILSPKLAEYFMENSQWVQKIHDFIMEKVLGWFANGFNIENWADSTQTYNTPFSFQNWFEGIIDSANQTLGDTATSIADSITTFLVHVISFIAIFLAIYILGKLLIFLLNKFAKLPVLNVFNKIGGVIIGAAKGVLLICILATLAYYLNLVIDSEGFTTAINNSFLIKYFYLNFLFS